MTYFYDYFAREYRESRKDQLLSAAILTGIRAGEVQTCRKILKNSFACYRDGRNVETLKRLTGEYREYVSCCHDGHARDRYNAFVYRYMVDAHVGSRAIAAKLGVVKETVWNYIDRCIDEMLVLCMGIPVVMSWPEDKRKSVRILAGGSRLFCNLAGDYVLGLFKGEKERTAVGQGRQSTRDIMGKFNDAVRVYDAYCHDTGGTDTDVRRAGILRKCLDGAPPAAIASEYGCSEGTVYADIRENERRLAAMLFDAESNSPK
mgnify:CR=1 FL=1